MSTRQPPVSSTPVGAARSRPLAAQPPWLHLWGVAERSESFKIMIADGNHFTIKNC